MAQRSSSKILAITLCIAALWLVSDMSYTGFVTPASQVVQSSEVKAPVQITQAARAALLSGILAVPEAAHAANQGYAILQVGWAVFIIGLGPAVLFWIYFNKPEIL